MEQTKQLLLHLSRSVPVEAEDLRQQCLRLTHEVGYPFSFPSNLPVRLSRLVRPRRVKQMHKTSAFCALN
jgi:hypothetical protein